MALFRRRTPRDPWVDRSDLGIARRAADVLSRVSGARASVQGSDASDLVLSARGLTLPLYNLILSLREKPVSDWDAMIERHVQAVASPQPSVSDLSESELRARVRTRLLPREGLPSAQYARPFAAGLELALCIDLPETVVTLTDRVVAALPLTLDELYDVGRRNTNAESIDESDVVTPGVWSITGHSLFIASRAADLPELLTEVGIDAPYGAVFTVPMRHMVLISPVTAETLSLVQGMVVFTQQLVTGQRGALAGGPLSGNLYFWGPDGYECIGSDGIGDHSFSVTMIPPFQAAIAAANGA